jgi:hypothetical protein
MSDPTPPPDSGLHGLRLIVFYRDGVESDSAHAANAAAGVTLVRPLAVAGAALVMAPAHTRVEDTLRLLREQPGVVEAEPDRRVSIAPR